MTWNYRIIRFKEYLALHEVHYEGEVPVSYSEPATSFVTEDDAADLIGALELALKSAKELPVLDVAVFGMPRDQRPKCPRSTST
jgi:hypothetical protein